jgi:hypothetical protein
MSRNQNALQWEEKVALEQREHGRSWRSIVRYFARLNNFAGVDATLRLAKLEAQALAA